MFTNTAAAATRSEDRAPLLKNLHQLRGLAAIAVVVSHLMHWHSFTVMDHFDKMLCFSGTYAVGVFFVISGFIIARSHRAEMGALGRIRSYAIKRFFRIYPAYWAYSLFFAALGALGIECWDRANILQRNPLEMISAIFLVPLAGAPNGFLAVSWSLYFEIIFYCVFATFFINRKLGFAVLGLFVMASVTRHTNPLTALYCINRINCLFLAGVLMGLYADRISLKYVSPLAMSVAGALCYAFCIYRTVQMNSHYVYLSAALLVGGAVAADLKGKQDKQTPHVFTKGLMWLGTISYSLYLCHVPVQAVLYRLLGSPYQSPVTAILYVIVPVLAGSAGYLLIEKPSQNLARKVLSQDKVRSDRAIAGAMAGSNPPAMAFMRPAHRGAVTGDAAP
jgi:peptidoglycan/LPS O-acetylase OafA/YrhL